MRWITDPDEVFNVRDLGRACTLLESGRMSAGFAKLYFDDITSLREPFGTLVQDLMLRSGDRFAYFCVTDPDPWLWDKWYEGAPAFEIGVGDSPKQYQEYLSREFQSRDTLHPGANMTDVPMDWVIAPPRFGWFSKVMRSARIDSGQLWTPLSWQQELVCRYPWLAAERWLDDPLGDRPPEFDHLLGRCRG